MKREITSYNTKKMMAESLKTVMKSKPVSKITVSEIINDCGINRKTFYYHFEDIPALLRWMFAEESIKILKKFDLIEEYEAAINFVMDYVETNDQLFNHSRDSMGSDALLRFFREDFTEISRIVIEQGERMTGKILDPAYKQFLCNFYVNAVSSVLADWVKNRNHRDRKAVTEYLATTIRFSLVGIFENSPYSIELRTE